MTLTKLGLFGICIAILGLMAFSAAGADAEGTWLILDPHGVVKTGGELPAVLELENDSEHYVLRTEILKIKVLFLCKGIAFVNAKIFGAGAVGKGPGEERETKILFSGCVTLLNEEIAPECVPTDPTDGKGFIVTKPLHILAGLHTLGTGVKDDVFVVLPDEGEGMATIALPASCPIGTSVPVIGTLVVKDCQTLALTHLVKHLVDPFEPLTKLWVISKTAEHIATPLGSAWAKLGGEHASQLWSISGL
ncbi:MAG TPA: hypothetical protein VG816_07660 [Solirubrobacterales bacterium]|nr:hypothetical protein [Solirubrobacterales bacterium]